MSLALQSIKPNTNQAYFNITYKAPKNCPHCDVVIHPTVAECQKVSYDAVHDLNFLSLKCTSCSQIYLITFLRSKKSEQSSIVSVYPAIQHEKIPTIIEEFSPKFMNIYKQAVAAEQLNHLELAATGYRIALEILSKDFALFENPDKENEIINQSLFRCINQYFSDTPLAVASHVVRILGNDYVHYLQKHPDVSFEEIKYFMNIFLLNIEMKLKIKNPPVQVQIPGK